MKLKPSVTDLLWMAAGAAVLLIVVLAALHFHQDPTNQLAFKARRLDLVGRIQTDLASASEAEKSAVLATTDKESQTFADQARTSSGKVDQERRELGELMTQDGLQREKEVLTQFSEAFAEFQRIDNDLLALAVKNTNVRPTGWALVRPPRRSPTWAPHSITW
jgi:hypothetical protein